MNSPAQTAAPFFLAVGFHRPHLPFMHGAWCPSLPGSQCP
jgi:hypothetical protein